MGENNCVWTRRPMLHRNTIELAEKKYRGKNMIFEKIWKFQNGGKIECKKSVIINTTGS